MNKKIIFIIPYAGGSFYSMKALQEELSDIDCCILELPGRGERIHEPLSNSLNFVVNDLYVKVVNLIKRYDDYYFFGHSLGSLLSYLIIQKIELSNHKKPKHLFVSGNAGPSNAKKPEDIHLLSEDDFWKEIEQIGGMTPEIIKSKELMAFFEPILKADLELVSNFFYVSRGKIDIPITAFFGSLENIEMEDKMLWQKETNVEIEIVEFEGNHFYIFNHWNNIARTILANIT